MPASGQVVINGYIYNIHIDYVNDTGATQKIGNLTAQDTTDIQTKIQSIANKIFTNPTLAPKSSSIYQSIQLNSSGVEIEGSTHQWSSLDSASQEWDTLKAVLNTVFIKYEPHPDRITEDTTSAATAADANPVQDPTADAAQATEPTDEPIAAPATAATPPAGASLEDLASQYDRANATVESVWEAVYNQDYKNVTDKEKKIELFLRIIDRLAEQQEKTNLRADVLNKLQSCYSPQPTNNILGRAWNVISAWSPFRGQSEAAEQPLAVEKVQEVLDRVDLNHLYDTTNPKPNLTQATP